MIRKTIWVAAASFFTYAALSIVFMAGPNPTSTVQAAPKSSKVTICHFGGHRGDFVTFNAHSHPDGNPLCLAEGGNPIVVAETACNYGHRVPPTVYFEGTPAVVTRTCADGDDQPTELPDEI